jgi:hypothetical protein
MIDIEVLSNPSAFKSKVNLDAVPKFNKHGDNVRLPMLLQYNQLLQTLYH